MKRTILPYPETKMPAELEKLLEEQRQKVNAWLISKFGRLGKAIAFISDSLAFARVIRRL